MIVSLNAAGKVFLQETEMEMGALVPRLQAITQNKPEQRIFVRADKTLPYGQVMEVMGTLSAAGFPRWRWFPRRRGSQPARPQQRPRTQTR